MTQAVRIFRKDFDYLRVEVAVFVLLCAVFVWMYPWAETLIDLAAVWLIARVVHSDAIAGDRQFWLTRPYRRRSLIAAKLLFIAVCISLPIAVAQLTIALRSGFSLKEAIPTLLLSQTLLFVFGGLPVLGLAALTSGMIPFFLAAMGLALVFLGGTAMLEIRFPGYLDSMPGPIEWIRSILFALPLAAITTVVLVRVYRSRDTPSGRIIGVAGLSVAALVFLFVPASFALKAQSWLSKKPGLASGISLSAHRTPYRAPGWYFGPRDTMAVPLTLVLNHLPPNAEVRADHLVLSASWPDRPVTFMRAPSVEKRSEEHGQATFAVTMIVNQPEFLARRTQPLTIEGSLYMTLFGDDEKTLISLRSPGVVTQDGLHCKAGRITDRAWMAPAPPGEKPEWHPADTIVCASLFQWPRKLVYAESGDYQSDFANTRISYAPFFWGVSLTPLEVRWSEAIEANSATIRTRKPLAHFRRDFEWTGAKFADFEQWRFMAAPPPPAPQPPPRGTIR